MGVSLSPDELEEVEELDPDPGCVVCPDAIEKLTNSVKTKTDAISVDREAITRFEAKKVRISLNTISIRHHPESKRPRPSIASRHIVCYGFVRGEGGLTLIQRGRRRRRRNERWHRAEWREGSAPEARRGVLRAGLSRIGIVR